MLRNKLKKPEPRPNDMGSFDGGLAYTFYPGSRLVQQEAVLTTYDADVAYYYDAGLDMTDPVLQLEWVLDKAVADFKQFHGERNGAPDRGSQAA